ncbi:lactose regulatory protein LAC9 [Xylariales sp. PMI_506]|nr:lactose regulatory protein LAC9 [Xylariales sp. PMI_506]
MAPSSTQSRSALACDACRIKKLKCSKDRPSCIACLQGRRPCHYSGLVIRSPLTRAYLTSVEHRVQNLEALINRLLPDVDIEKSLASELDQPQVSPLAPEIKPALISSPGPSRSVEQAAGTPESVPPEADGFDWQEKASSVNDLTDGMASLAIEPAGHGYLGSTAGVFFLRSLLFWLGERSSTPSQRSAEQEYRAMADQSFSSSRLVNLMASHQVTESLINCYFSDYHLTYPFLHEATFRAQYHEIIPRPPQRSWEMLLCTVLALGSWCSNTEQPDLGDHFYHCALYLGDDESMFESANLTSVQALVLLSNLAQKRNKPNTGWNFLGLATRMAVSLGLHRALPEWNISLLQREMRCRVWWGLYIFDSGASTTFGRPILLPALNEMDVQRVLNITDNALTPQTTIMPKELSHPTIYSGLKAQSDFHIHSNSISNRLLSANGLSPDEALAMNQELEDWSKTLPKYFTFDYESSSEGHWFSFARARLWWRFWNLKTTLFRQLLLRRIIRKTGNSAPPASPPLEEKCRDLCINAAHLTVVSINDYLGQACLTRLEGWYTTFFLFHACLVIALAILGDAESPEVQNWQVDIEMTVNIFRNVLKENHLAARCANILDRILPAGLSGLSDVDVTQFGPNAAEMFGWGLEMNQMFGWPDAASGYPSI